VGAGARDAFGFLSGVTRRGLSLEFALLLSAFALLIILTIASLWLSQRTAADRTENMNARETTENILALENAIRTAESAQRGYMLSGGDRSFLRFYAGNVQLAHQLLAALDTKFASRPLEGRYSATKELVREKLTEVETALKLYNDGAVNAAAQLVKDGVGRELMRQIVEGMAQLKAEIKSQTARNEAETEFLDSAVFYLNLSGVALVILFTSSSGYMLWRSNTQLEAAQDQLEENNKSLELTVEERTRSLREANEEIQRFAYIVSHDLRSPLVNIMGFTTELETLSKELFSQQDPHAAPGASSPKPETLRQDFAEALGFIKTSIAKMDRLIGAILKISREGARPFNPEPLDVTRLLESIVASMKHQVDEAGAVVTIDQLPRITTDRLAMEQVFSNLIDNALKFRQSDQPARIHVSALKLNRLVQFSVQDNGRGIAEKDRTRVFELFRRAGVQDRPGEGMGLSYVQTLVRRLGGSIRLESELGKGATFHVILPEYWSQ
jgi:hypothetical protein